MFQITEEQRALRKTLREFVDREILPQAASFEQSAAFPNALFIRLGELGFLDLTFYHQREGALHNGVDSMIVMEELARGLPSAALSMSPHVQCMNLIEAEGSTSLRERVVSKALRGEHVLAFAITEASGGSDALGIDTTATFDGDGWILNGEKCWITNAGAADGYIVSAKSATSGRYRDVSLFYVDAKTLAEKLIASKEDNADYDITYAEKTTAEGEIFGYSAWYAEWLSTHASDVPSRSRVYYIQQDEQTIGVTLYAADAADFEKLK